MIVLLLSCGTSWSSNTHLFYGGATDSVLVSYEDLRTANAKMVELEYEKEINRNLCDIIHNDSLIISGLDDNLRNVIQINKVRTRKLKRQRNILGAGCGVSIICLILSLIK